MAFNAANWLEASVSRIDQQIANANQHIAIDIPNPHNIGLYAGARHRGPGIGRQLGAAASYIVKNYVLNRENIHDYGVEAAAAAAHRASSTIYGAVLGKRKHLHYGTGEKRLDPFEAQPDEKLQKAEGEFEEDARILGTVKHGRNMPYGTRYGRRRFGGRKYYGRKRYTGSFKRRRIGFRATRGHRAMGIMQPKMSFPWGLSKKWLDVYLNETVSDSFTMDSAVRSGASPPPCAGAAAGVIARMSSLFSAITQGSAVGNRIGDRIICHNMFLDFDFIKRQDTAEARNVAPAASYNTAFDAARAVMHNMSVEDFIHVIVVKDTQANGAAPTLGHIYTTFGFSTETSGVPDTTCNWQRNMLHVLQYKVLAHKKIKWTPNEAIFDIQPDAVPAAAPITSWNWGVLDGTPTAHLTLAFKCSEIINFNASTGAIGDVADNNVCVFVITQRTNADAAQSKLHLRCAVSYRIRYQDCC